MYSPVSTLIITRHKPMSSDNSLISTSNNWKYVQVYMSTYWWCPCQTWNSADRRHRWRVACLLSAAKSANSHFPPRPYQIPQDTLQTAYRSLSINQSFILDNKIHIIKSRIKDRRSMRISVGFGRFKNRLIFSKVMTKKRIYSIKVIGLLFRGKRYSC